MPAESKLPYIIKTAHQQRESHAIRQLLATHILREMLFMPLGLPEFSWYLIEVNNAKLSTSIVGEVDILGGRLSWKDPAAFRAAMSRFQASLPSCTHPTRIEQLTAVSMAQDGGIVWPPPTNYLVGVEVKCAYFENGKIRSPKSSVKKTAGMRKQLEKLTALSLNRVALLDIIANHPADDEGSCAWFAASLQAYKSCKSMSSVLGMRLPDGSTVDQFVWSVGAITGGDETVRVLAVR